MNLSINSHEHKIRKENLIDINTSKIKKVSYLNPLQTSMLNKIPIRSRHIINLRAICRKKLKISYVFLNDFEKHI